MILRLSALLLVSCIFVGCNDSLDPSVERFLEEDFSTTSGYDSIRVWKEDLDNAKVYVTIQDGSSESFQEFVTDCRFDENGSPIFNINLPYETNIVSGEIVCASQVIGRIEETIPRSQVLAKNQ